MVVEDAVDRRERPDEEAWSVTVRKATPAEVPRPCCGFPGAMVEPGAPGSAAGPCPADRGRSAPTASDRLQAIRKAPPR